MQKPNRIRLPDGRSATVRHWFSNGYCTFHPDGSYYDAAEQLPAVNFAKQSDVEVIDDAASE